MKIMNKSYQDYLKSSDWEDKKSKKYSKLRRCAICGDKENLDIHHLNYKNLTDCEQSDLRILCRRCHFTTHNLYKACVFHFRNTNHHSRFAIIKNAVKKHLHIQNTNMFVS